MPILTLLPPQSLRFESRIGIQWGWPENSRLCRRKAQLDSLRISNKWIDLVNDPIIGQKNCEECSDQP